MRKKPSFLWELQDFVFSDVGKEDTEYLKIRNGSGRNITIWTLHRSGDLVFLDSKQTVMRYLDVLADQVHFTMLNFYPDDLKGNYTSWQMCSADQSDLQQILWTPQGPDLNLMENVWGAVERHIREHSFLSSPKRFIATSSGRKVTPEARRQYPKELVQLSMQNCGVFSEAVKWLQCGATGLNLSCEENCSGGAADLDIICDICSYSYNFCSSKKCKAEIGKPSTYEVNTRLVYAMRCIGKGAEAARMFCGIMNLPPPPTKSSKYNKMLLGTTKDVCDATMKDAVKEAVEENQNIRDIPVVVDGTWQKRGYSSMNGVVTVTSVDTGKVIDTEILSKHCVCKDKKKHGPVCKKNFNGYSGRMEVDGTLSIFQRSVQRYDVSYTKYLGDGDSKAFDNIVKNEVYGDNCTITKLECIGHVMKRMGSRLRRFKAKMRGQKLSDDKALCGKNRLTEASIDQLQTYYGLAIRRNLSSVKDVRQGIWAIFLHKISTDETPQHGFCPSGPDTWCRYKKAQLENKVYHHKHKFPVAVVEAIRPIFRNLSNPELLKKCLHGNT
ncbi:uncharacterized protein TNCV_2237021 [Trichonephila clavipes]|nr:uncharacterized protein TNCV_2237021 [Trichonephila clavipes]